MKGIVTAPPDQFPCCVLGQSHIEEVRYQQFVPYFETCIRDHTDPQMSAYFELLRRHTHKVMVTLIENNFFANNNLLHDDLLQHIIMQSKTDPQLSDLDSLMGGIDLDEEKNSLLRMLRQVLSKKNDPSFVKWCQKVLQPVNQHLISDRLLQNVLHERILGPCVQLVLDNTRATSTFHVIGLLGCDTELPLVTPFVKALSSKCNIQFTAIVQNKSSNQPASQYEVIYCNSLMNIGTFVEKADLVLSLNFLNKQSNIENTISTLRSFLQEGSFLLIMEPAYTLLIPLILFLFQDHPITDPSVRTCGAFCDDVTWVKHLANFGLETVSQKSDAFMFTIYLCKTNVNQHSALQGATLVEIFDNDFNWIAKVDKSLADGKKGDKPIWIRKSGYFHTGIDRLLPIYQKKSKGHRLRFVAFVMHDLLYPV